MNHLNWELSSRTSELIQEGRKCCRFGMQVSCLSSRHFGKLSRNATVNSIYSYSKAHLMIIFLLLNC